MEYFKIGNEALEQSFRNLPKQTQGVVQDQDGRKLSKKQYVQFLRDEINDAYENLYKAEYGRLLKIFEHVQNTFDDTAIRQVAQRLKYIEKEYAPIPSDIKPDFDSLLKDADQAMAGRDVAMETSLSGIANGMGLELWEKYRKGDLNFLPIEKKYKAKYLGGFVVYRLKVDGRNVAVKFFLGQRRPRSEIMALKAMRGNLLFQQYLADGGIKGQNVYWIATYLVDGIPFDVPQRIALKPPPKPRSIYTTMLRRKIEALPDGHWDQLIRIFKTAYEKGILIDTVGRGNLFYDITRGFTVIDYRYSAKAARLSLHDLFFKEEYPVNILTYPYQRSNELRSLILNKIRERIQKNPEFDSILPVQNRGANDAMSAKKTGGIDLTSDKALNIQNNGRDLNSILIPPCSGNSKTPPALCR